MDAIWYYVGHYGQLGPLTLEQVEELISGGVISPDTYVWRNGMTDWVMASAIQELGQIFRNSAVYQTPPPSPSLSAPPPMQRPRVEAPAPFGAVNPYSQPNLAPLMYGARSDRNHVLAGVLNIVFAGAGRMYLGYWAIGVLQLVVSVLTCGVGIIWPFVDGIILMTGSVKHDGYGRRMLD